MDQSSFDDLLRIQRMMASKLMEETSMDAKIKLFDLIREMVTGKNKQIAVEQIILEAQIQGFQENETLMLLEELKTDHYIVSKGEGFIALA